jgi:hypothetical protein
MESFSVLVFEYLQEKAFAFEIVDQLDVSMSMSLDTVENNAVLVTRISIWSPKETNLSSSTPKKKCSFLCF